MFYFKKKIESCQKTIISFGAYEEKDITEQGDLLCKDIFTVCYDSDTDEISWDTESDYFELDEIDNISVEEYTKVLSTFEFVKELEEKLLKTLIRYALPSM